MEEPIVNRVANSALMTIDLEDFYPKGERIGLDISAWLKEGVLLIEKDFREQLKNHDWSAYQNAYVYLYCSTDALLPAWSFLLVSTYLNPVAKFNLKGSQEELDFALLSAAIDKIDFEQYRDKNVILKGCGKYPVPENAYLYIAEKLQRVVHKLMYGEACSSVPLYKK